MYGAAAFAATPFATSPRLSALALCAIDALVQRAGITSPTTIDALLLGTANAEIPLDALLSAVLNNTLTIDALLHTYGLNTATVDAILYRYGLNTATVDAILKISAQQPLSIDAIIGQIGDPAMPKGRWVTVGDSGLTLVTIGTVERLVTIQH